MENSNNISIKTISDLLKCNFYIPSYQRGYRWTEQQVKDLLNDINEFSPKEIPNSDEKTWYCLQPNRKYGKAKCLICQMKIVNC